MEDDASHVVIDLLIKFGGSAITHKDKFEEIKTDALQAAVNILKECTNRNLTCVVVHGAGKSFGHPQAKKYKVQEGLRNSHDKQHTMHGFCLTRLSVTKSIIDAGKRPVVPSPISGDSLFLLLDDMLEKNLFFKFQKLNHMVVDSLVSNNVHAVGLPGLSHWESHNRTVVKHNVQQVKDLLAMGLVPVLHGDCVLDTYKGCSILSGDDIIKTFCREFSVKKLVFLTDVLGVYDRPPTEEDAKLISKITVGEDGKILQHVSTSTAKCDVTGGIRHKLDTAVDVILHSKQTTPVYVCQVTGTAGFAICCDEDNLPDDVKYTLITKTD